MMTTVLVVLCLYLAACYAYGGVLLVNTLRGRGAPEASDAAPADDATAASGPRPGIARSTRTTGPDADAHDDSDAVDAPVRAAA